MTWGYVAVAIVAIVGYLWLIPIYGMWGAVWVTLASEALIAFITFFVVYKVSGALPSLKTTGKALIAALVMYAFLVFVPSPHVLLSVLFGAIVYLLVMLLIGGISRENMMRMLNPKKGV